MTCYSTARYLLSVRADSRGLRNDDVDGDVFATVRTVFDRSLPSTFVLPSTRNCIVFTSWSFKTSREKAASPTDEIFPDADWLSGADLRWLAKGWAGSGMDQAASVKQKTNNVAKLSTVRNRIEFPPTRFGPGRVYSGTNPTKAGASFESPYNLFRIIMM